MTNRLLCILVAMGALLVGTAVGQTTKVSDETRAASGDLNREQAQEVEAFITFCTERMIDPAADLDVIKSCRVAMTGAYEGGEGYMRHFARTTEQVFVPATLKAEQSPVVQVNGAMVVAEIARPELAPLLERMFTHPNAAVRYYAVKGFDRIVPAVVAQGSDASETTFKALEAFARQSTDPPMIRVLIQALDLSEIDPDRVSPAVLNVARNRAIEIIQEVLRTHLQAIRDGSAGMADAAGFGVEALAAMGKELTEEQRKPLLGMIANVAANAGEAFKELSIIDQDGTERLEQAPGAIIMLMVYCERAVGTLTGSREGAVSRQLPPKDVGDVRQALLAMNNLVGYTGGDGDLQKLGVPRPTLLPRSPEAVTAGR